ncbi:hypothetical protein F5B21DRAFT_505718 [Xylaria acuta]|nr:hypothetical protein F5B21DRAFT_505718 [Xylaria acuta]
MRAMFPPKETASSTVASLKALSTRILASIVETLQEDTVYKKVPNHDVFADWVKPWTSSSEHKCAVGIGKVETLATIQKLASELKDVSEAKSLNIIIRQPRQRAQRRDEQHKKVGAGSAGAISPVLKTLALTSTLKRFKEYVFIDSAGWFVTEAQSRFSGHDGFVFQTLDVLRNPIP